MATIDEVFESMGASDVTSFEYLLINPETRTISVPESEMIFGVQQDEKAERKYFMSPRFVASGLDLAGCFIQVNYRNANGDKDFYPVTDAVYTEDYITFSWELDKNVTAYQGEIQFSVNFDNRKREWNTTTASGRSLAGLPIDESNIESETSDGVARLREMVDAQTAAVEAEGATQIQNVIDEANQQLELVADEGIAQLNAVIEEGESQRTAVEAKGAATLATIPEDYTETSDVANKALRTRANAVVGTEEGEIIQLTDSSDDYLRGMRVFGKSSQMSTTGAQLANLPDLDGAENSGITWSCKNGIVTAVGTTTGTSATSGSNITFSLLGMTGTYTISGSTNKTMVYVSVENSDGRVWYTNQTFTLDGTETMALLYCQITGSGVYVKETIYPMLNAGETALPWEPYTGGISSPNPEYPQEIESVNNPIVRITGKNLITETSVEFTRDHYIHLGMMYPPGTYSFSAHVTSTDTDAEKCSVMFYVNEKDFVRSVQVNRNENDTDRSSFKTTVDDPFNAIRVYASTSWGLSEGDTGSFSDIMLEYAAEGSEYEPSDIQTTSLSYALSGIPVDSDGNYTDENGQQWVCDEIDYERGVYIQRIGTWVIDENSSVNSDKDSEGVNKYPYRYYSWCTNRSLAYTNALCDRLNVVKTVHVTGTGSEHMGISCPTNYMCFYFNMNQYMAEDTVDACKAALADYPLTIKYVLKTPIETPLTDVDIHNLSQLHSNYPTTAVFNDSGAHAEISYNKDTTTVIQKLIDAITALGGTV